MYIPDEKLDPVQQQYQRRYFRRKIVCLIVLAAIGSLIYWRYFVQVPVEYASDLDHFKYGSIGADTSGGVPYWIWQVMPGMFPEYLPDPEAFTSLPPEKRTALAGYLQFGFLHEEGHELPIGFSKRRDVMDRVGLNCAVCHTGAVRVTDGMDPTRIYGYEPEYAGHGEQRAIVYGMPGNTVQLIPYFEFLFTCAADGRFTPDNIMAHIEARTSLNPIDKTIYRLAIPTVRQFLLVRKQQLAYVPLNPPDGPGRVDTFNPYKVIEFGFPLDGTIGTADFPSIWNQRAREGMHLHWDGNNTSVFERNISASLGAGATAVSLDMPRMLRTASWIGAPDPRVPLTPAQIAAAREHPVPHPDELQIPRYPFPINAELAAKGEPIYQKYCAGCHSFDGEYVGTVVPYDKIGTDRYRLDSYTEELSVNQNTLGAGQWWRFHNFRKTYGYANSPLDGIWARAPFLHNGSVPTLRDLLKPATERPKTFFRGDEEYDPQNVGFRSDRARDDEGRKLFEYDTSVNANSNGGHEGYQFGTELSDADKDALVEYMKQL